MDATVVANGRSAKVRASELCSRAADARAAAERARRQSEAAFDRAATVLSAFAGRPFGDRGGRFLLQVGRARPVVRFVRHDFRRWLEEAGVPAESLGEVILACSEACANAVEHAQHAARQLVEIDAAITGGELELRIRDFGAWNERRGSPMRGRGLDLIRDLVDSLDVQRTPQGSEVVMRRVLTSTP